MHYGFTIENNRESDGRCQNELQTNLRLPAEDPLRDQRLRLVSLTKSTRITMTHDDAATQEALSFVRVCAASEAELASLSATGRSPYQLASNPIRPISPENEINALLYVEESCVTQHHMTPRIHTVYTLYTRV